MVKFTSEAMWSWAFLCWRFLTTDSVSTSNDLFEFSICSWFSLGRLYVSRNLSISSRLSSLLTYNWLLVVSCDPFNVLLGSIWEYFVENFCIYIHQGYLYLYFVCVMSLSDFAIRVSVSLINKFGNVPSSSNFLKKLKKYWC